MKRPELSGENHYGWKGDDVGYAALHDWVKKYFPAPERCQDCNHKKPLDLANISGEYKRDPSDWEYLCRSCHMKKDGRLMALMESPNRIKNLRRGESHYLFGHPELHPMLGKHPPKSTREKISKAMKGRLPWNTGKKLKPLTEKMKKKIAKSLKGRVFSEEHRRKLSIRAKERFIKYGKAIIVKS